MSIHEEEGRLLHDMFFHKLPVRWSIIHIL